VNRRFLPYGDRAVLVELDTIGDVLAMHAAALTHPPRGVVDIVPAARTLTATIDPAVLTLDRARRWLEELRPVAVGTDVADAVMIDVDYSGDDLAEVADLLGVDPAEVIRIHTQSTWRVAFGGFTLGFGYLVTDHDRLVVPRRAAARTSVPAGSVALAAEFTGVYPRSGPGGWQLIGTTDAVLWDPAREPAALLTPGRIVRFRSRS
jgi:KipI family sensor histidine kinase inhibitor